MSYPVYMVPAGDVLPVMFSSYAGSTGASVTLSGLAVTDIEIYKDGSTTQRSSDAGYTLLDTDGIDFDGVTGIHGFSIDTGDNTDSGFYTVGAWFHVVVSAVTIDSQTVSFIACAFRLMAAEGVAGKPKADVDAFGGTAGTFSSGRPEVNTTHAAGTAWGSGAITAASIASDAITAAKIADGAIDAATFAAGAINASAIASDAITAAKIADGAIDAATFASGAINAAAIASDAITDAKVASDVTIASVTGAVGSVTGNVGGNVSGSVGSVVGAVGSVTGDVGGNVVGSVASVTAGVTVTTNNDKTGYTLSATGSAAMTEGYAALGATATLPQLLYEVRALLAEKSISSTTLTTKKLDGSTTAATYTLDDDTTPSAITRST